METILSILIGLGIVIFTLIIGIAIIYLFGFIFIKIFPDLDDVIENTIEQTWRRLLIGFAFISILCVLLMLCYFAYNIGTNILTNIN